jgi:hypothetical protein
MASSSVVDPTSDRNKSMLVRLAGQYELPELVKQADLDETMYPDHVSVSTYADPRLKKFACHSAAATLLSAVYFVDQQGKYHAKDREMILDRFSKAANYFRVRPQYDAIIKQGQATKQDADLPDSAYAYVWKSDDGRTDRFYPMTNTLTTKRAAEWLFSNRDRIPLSERRPIAHRIHIKASSFGAALGDQLETFIDRQLGYGIPEKSEILAMLQHRGTLSKTAAQRQVVSDLTEAVRSRGDLLSDTDTLIKLAETVDMLDYTLQLKGKYGGLIQRPEDVIFGVTFTKAASEYSRRICTLQTGAMYNREQLTKLSRDSLESAFGTDFADEVCTGLQVDAEKLAVVASTLPRPDAQLLEAVLAEAGQHAQDKSTLVDRLKAGQDDYQGILSDSELQAIASRY